MSFNFSTVEVPTNTERKEYLNPGMYHLKLQDVELFETTPKDPNKEPTKGMSLTFVCKSDNPDFNEAICNARFFLTPKTMGRVQYLHNGIFGQPITQNFNTADEIVTYFQRAAVDAPYVKMITGGKIYNNKVYSDLPYMGFFPDENQEFVERAFEVNSKEFQSVMTSDKKTISDDDFSGEESNQTSMFEDSPFE